MNDNKNMILAIVLSLVILLGWGFVTERYFQPAQDPSTEFIDGKQVAIPQPEADPTSDRPVAIRERREVIAATPRIPIRTPRLEGSINLRGARIDDLVLTEHRQSLAPDAPPIRLFSPAGAPDAYFGSFGWTGEGLEAPGPDTVWQASGEVLAPGSPVTLQWANDQGQVFQIRLSIDDQYLFTAEQRVLNRGSGAVAARPYTLISRVGESPDPDTWTVHVGPIGVFDGAADYGTDFDGLAEEGASRFTSRGGWLGFTDKYWLAAAIPEQDAAVDAAFRYNRATDSYQADFAAPATIVPPGQAAGFTTRLFAGAKEVQLLEAYSEALGTRLEKAIDWGWFEWFMKPIFSLLNWLHAAIGNFGLAIIGLTIIVRLLLFPIAQKQFASMAAMRVVQPKMKEIQERYKDDKRKMQEEMLKLYREEKVNPMAGCLPILLQIPIFYALYKVLMVAVEMRHEPFVAWLKDLSAPDPLTPVNLFGFLPFDPPSLLAVGILPILVGVTMWIQFKLNPAPMDPVQQQVFSWMPWILMFIMAPFAAGLQLYWAVNNIISIGQQKLLYARHPVLRQRPDATAPPPDEPEPKPAAPAPAAAPAKPRAKPKAKRRAR